MIYTGNYANCLSGNLISISFDRGKDADFHGRCYSKLAPIRTFWRIWKQNRGIIPERENNQYYVKCYFDQVLSHLDPQTVLQELGDDPILLCYEKGQEFCHRHIVAEWLEMTLHVEVKEIAIDEAGNITFLERPKYIRELLEQVM